MAPKKSKKISLNEFLGDSTLGSWADEMDSLPNAPAARIDEEQPGDRFGRRGDDFLSSRPDRQHAPPREDVPLPSQPPYTAFVGNLAFDLTEAELGQFFTGSNTKSVKIIRDKDDKPKGFGYVEFEELEGLKDALSKSGSNFSGRVIRVSVAEPPKERSGFGGQADDNAKFDNPWRRDGPLPDLPASREQSRRRFEGPSSERQQSTTSDGPDDWRSSRPQRAPEPELPAFKRKGSGFLNTENNTSTADKEEAWTMGSKFKPSTNVSAEEAPSKFGSTRAKGDMGPPKELPSDEGDWRSSSRKPPARSSVSPNNSTPPTPQLARRKLELLPRSGSASASASPLSSPKMGPTPPVSGGTTRGNPFGGARPVDVSLREKEVGDRLQREREAQQEKLSMSRSNSRTGVERTTSNRSQTPPSTSPGVPQKSVLPKSSAPTVRPSLSFANVAAKRDAGNTQADEMNNSTEDQLAGDITKVDIL